MERPCNIRVKVNFFGRVQGVGFRYRTHQIAQSHSVTGYVENHSDGSVHLVVEGTAPAVDTFLTELCDSMKRYISRRESHESPSLGEFSDFSIRH